MHLTPPTHDAAQTTLHVLANRRKRSRRGMTLVEILIVLTILAGIMVTVGVVAINQLNNAKIKESKLRLNKLSNKIQEFYAFQEPNGLPDELGNLVSPPGGESPYVKPEDIKDSWGNDVIYNKTSDRNYELRSPGPDGQDGNDDDITVEE